MHQGYGNIFWNLGSALGGPLGGLCGDTLGWRWAFLMQVPLCFIHFGIAYWKIENSFDPNFDESATDTWAKVKKVDFLGSVTLVAGIATGLIGLSLGGNQFPWDDVAVWGSLFASAILLTLFCLIEIFVASKPLLAPELLFTRAPGFITLTSFFTSMS